MRLIPFKFTAYSMRDQIECDCRMTRTEEDSRCVAVFGEVYFSRRHEQQNDMCVHNIIYINSHRLEFTQRIRRTISSQLLCFFFCFSSSSSFCRSVIVSLSSPTHIEYLCIACAQRTADDADSADESKCDEQKRSRERISFKKEDRNRRMNDSMQRLITIRKSVLKKFCFLLSHFLVHFGVSKTHAKINAAATITNNQMEHGRPRKDLVYSISFLK